MVHLMSMEMEAFIKSYMEKEVFIVLFILIMYQFICQINNSYNNQIANNNNQTADNILFVLFVFNQYLYILFYNI